MPELFPFQEKDVQKALGRNTLIASECGIGKTVEAIEVVRRRRVAGARGPVLVLCNNSAKEQWADFIRAWDPGVEVVVTGKAGSWPTEGRPGVELRHYFHPRHDVWILAHHEALSLPRKAEVRARRYYQAPQVWRQFIWEAIIVDECHRYKGRKSQRTVWLMALDGLYRMGMTGTLIEKDPSDAQPILKWLYPGRPEFKNYWKFREEWCFSENGWQGHKKWGGVKPGREREFAALLEPFTIRRGKRDPDVAPDLPPKIEEVVHLTMEPDSPQYKLYSKVARSQDLQVKLPPEFTVGGDWHLIIPNAMALLVRLQQLLADPRILGLRAPSVKQDWIKDYVADNPNEPIVIFTKFRPVAQTLAQDLGAAIAIGGRVERLDDWQRGAVQVLVGTIAKMGESLNLQQARTALFMDHEWSSIKMQQAYDRVDRIDITESKHIVHLEVKGTVDVLVRKALSLKWSEQELIWNFLRDLQASASTP